MNQSAKDEESVQKKVAAESDETDTTGKGLERDGGDSTADISQTTSAPKKVGYAQIKSEFLLIDYKPKIQTEYLSEDVKRKIAATNDEGQDKNDEGDEPANKKPKLKGRNKKRPRNERIEHKDKLCPAIKEKRECKFGESCKFNHDVKDYFEKKRPDIEGICPNFASIGFCRYGLTCRFAKSHLGEDQENLINNELYDKSKGKPLCINTLKEETKIKLWKRKYDFSQSMQSVKAAQTLLSNTKGTCDSETRENSESLSEEVLKAEEEDTNSQMNDDAVDNAIQVPISNKDPKMTAVSAKDSVTNLDDVPIRETQREVKKIDFHNKLYLAPLTTVGNLPFRRVCKNYGAEVTCSEMALASPLLKGKASEWSLIKRHPSEDIFGVQVCGGYPDMMTKCAQVLTETCDLDFIDINCGCPIDLIFKKGCGSALMGKATKLENICRSMMGVMGETPLTVKLRTGVFDHKNVAHNIIPRLRDAGVSLVTIHGRSREQRYTKLADWNYIDECANLGSPMPVFGNGDILSYEDANQHMESLGVSGVMIARGALIKPWIFTEIKEQRHWDISSSERFDILRSFSNYGLEHWGSDHQGVETTRRFLLEWLSFLHRYIPVGVLEQVPQKINERPPYYVGRNDLETMMASTSCSDWIKLSEMLLGPVPSNFQFLPKHKANAYQ